VIHKCNKKFISDINFADNTLCRLEESEGIPVHINEIELLLGQTDHEMEIEMEVLSSAIVKLQSKLDKLTKRHHDLRIALIRSKNCGSIDKKNKF